jgi:hypothetical protein
VSPPRRDTGIYMPVMEVHRSTGTRMPDRHRGTGLTGMRVPVRPAPGCRQNVVQNVNHQLLQQLTRARESDCQ